MQNSRSQYPVPLKKKSIIAGAVFEIRLTGAQVKGLMRLSKLLFPKEDQSVALTFKSIVETAIVAPSLYEILAKSLAPSPRPVFKSLVAAAEDPKNTRN